MAASLAFSILLPDMEPERSSTMDEVDRRALGVPRRGGGIQGDLDHRGLFLPGGQDVAVEFHVAAHAGIGLGQRHAGRDRDQRGEQGPSGYELLHAVFLHEVLADPSQTSCLPTQ